MTLNCSAASTESQGTKASFQWKKDNVVGFIAIFCDQSELGGGT